MAPKDQDLSTPHKLGSKIRRKWNAFIKTPELQIEGTPENSVQSVSSSRSGSPSPAVEGKKMLFKLQRVDASPLSKRPSNQILDQKGNLTKIYTSTQEVKISKKEAESCEITRDEKPPPYSASLEALSQHQHFLAVESNAETNESTSGSTSGLHVASEVAKTCLRVLKESSDAFPPLKSVVSGISFFIENYEKWEQNKETLQRLTVRILRLTHNSKETTGRVNGSAEAMRREGLERKLLSIAKDLEELKQGNQVLKYFMANDESGILSSIIEEINMAIIDYQVALQQDIYDQILSLIKSADMEVLKDMPRAKSAGYQSRETNAGCQPGTRVGVLDKLDGWASDRGSGSQPVYWLNGHAGSGKSTISYSFCEHLYAIGQLGASFFCSRDFSERSDIKLIFSTLAFQLACRYPSFRVRLVDALRKWPDLGSESTITQLTELLVGPLKASGISTTLVIDALDECKDPLNTPASTVLSLLARVIEKIPNVKFFVTGRPEAPIFEGFRIEALRSHTEIMLLHEVKHSDIERDITLYIRACLYDLIKYRRDLRKVDGWPPEDKVAILVSKSSNYFIFASTSIKLISAPPPSDPREVLEELTDSSSTNFEGKGGIDNLYLYVLSKAFFPSSKKLQAELRLILGTIFLCFNPLTSIALSDLLNTQSLETRLDGFRSLLWIPESDSECVRIYHKSLPDYLTDRERCSNQPFYIDPTVYHAEIAIACLSYMKRYLRKNICSLPRYALNSSISIEQRRQCIGETLEYACRFWAQHVENAAFTGEHTGRLIAAVCDFLQERQILWLQVLSLLDDTHRSIVSLREVKDWLLKVSPRYFMSDFVVDIFDQTNKGEPVDIALRWLEDGLLLVLRFVNCIRLSACHLYHSVLPLAPTSSLLRNAHAHDLMTEVKVLRGSHHWDTQRAFRLNIEAHGSKFHLTFSYSGNMLAIANRKRISVFNVVTGQRMYLLGGILPNDDFTAPKFVAHDRMILSARGRIVELWDVHTGSLIRHYEGPNTGGLSLDMSPDQKYIASGDRNGCVFVWNTSSGVLASKVETENQVLSISFSPASDSLFVCSWGTIRRWQFPSCNRFVDDFKFKRNVNCFTISDDRLVLAAYEPHKYESHIELYSATTKQVIWEHHGLGRLISVPFVYASEQTILISRGSKFEVASYSAPSAFKILATTDGLVNQDIYSSTVAFDRRNSAYRVNNGIFIHPTASFQPQISDHADSLNPVNSMCSTLDGKMGLALCRQSSQIRVCNLNQLDRDIILNVAHEVHNPWKRRHLTSASLTPNMKWISILSNSSKYGTIDFWDLERASVICAIRVNDGPKGLFMQFIDNDTYLIAHSVSRAGNFNERGPQCGFSALPSRRNENWAPMISGAVGSAWRLRLPQSSEHQAWIIKIKATHSEEGEQFCHLQINAYSSSDPCPRLLRSTTLEYDFLRDKHNRRILWSPHDLRNAVFCGKSVLMGGNSGLLVALDFTETQDDELDDSTILWTQHTARIKEYMDNLCELSTDNRAMLI